MEGCTCSFENSMHDYSCELTPTYEEILITLENRRTFKYRTNYVLNRNWMSVQPEQQNDSMLFFIQKSQDEQRIIPSIIPGEFEIHDDCSICNCKIDKFNAVKSSGCGHCFHENCLKQWIYSDCVNHNRCPYCRETIHTILKKN